MGFDDALKNLTRAGNAPKKPETYAYGIYSNVFDETSPSERKKIKKAHSMIGRLDKGETLHVVMMKDVNVEHIIGVIADQLGPCDLVGMCWVMGEGSSKKLKKAAKAGAFRRIEFVMDPRARDVRESRLNVARQICHRIEFLANHAKIYCLSNGDMCVTVIGSANLNRNDRIENVAIYTDETVYGFYRGTINQMLDGSDPFGAGVAQFRKNKTNIARRK